MASSCVLPAGLTAVADVRARRRWQGVRRRAGCGRCPWGAQGTEQRMGGRRRRARGHQWIAAGRGEEPSWLTSPGGLIKRHAVIRHRVYHQWHHTSWQPTAGVLELPYHQKSLAVHCSAHCDVHCANNSSLHGTRATSQKSCSVVMCTSGRAQGADDCSRGSLVGRTLPSAQ